MIRHLLTIAALLVALPAAAQPATPAEPAPDPKPADAKPAAPDPADAKPADAKPAPPKAAAPKAKTAKKKPAKRRRGPKRDWPVDRPAHAKNALPPLGPAPYQPGERLKFEVRMFGATAGEAILAVGQRQQVGGRTLLPLVGFVRSSEFLDKFYPVDDKMVVVLDEDTFLPVKTDFYINENKKSSSYHTQFDQRGKLIRSTRKRAKGTLVREFVPAAPVFEPLGSIFGMRRMDLQPGMRIEYFAWTGLRERWVQAEVVKTERIWTPMGWYDALRIDVKTTLTGGFLKNAGELKEAAGKVGTVWIGTDPARTPLKVVTPTRIGDAEAILVNRYIESGAALPTAAGK